MRGWGGIDPIFTTKKHCLDAAFEESQISRQIRWVGAVFCIEMENVSDRQNSDPQPSDPGGPVRPSLQMTKIMKVDRIDDRGDIREHFTRDGKTTICGIEIGMRQTPCGNAPCLRCKKIFDRLSETAARGVMEVQTP